MTNATQAQTFEAWLRETLEPETIQDLAEHGASAGWPELTYYKDTLALYERFEHEIWDALCEDAEAMGYPHSLALAASFNGAGGVGSDATFRNLLVWYMAERIARNIADSLEVEDA